MTAGIFRAARRITSNVPNENSADAGQISSERAPPLDVRRISDLRPTRPKREEPPLVLSSSSSMVFFLSPFSLFLSLSLMASWKARVDARTRLRRGVVLNG